MFGRFTTIVARIFGIPFIRRPRLEQGERVRGEITSSEGQEAFIPITVSGTGKLTVLEASFYSVQTATFGTGSRGHKDSVRPSLSCCLGLVSPTVLEARLLHSELVSYSFWKLENGDLELISKQKATLGRGSREPTVLEARLLHSQLVSYSFRMLESGNLELVSCRFRKQR